MSVDSCFGPHTFIPSLFLTLRQLVNQYWWTQTDIQYQKASMHTEKHHNHIQPMMCLSLNTHLQCSWVTHRVIIKYIYIYIYRLTPSTLLCLDTQHSLHMHYSQITTPVNSWVVKTDWRCNNKIHFFKKSTKKPNHLLIVGHNMKKDNHLPALPSSDISLDDHRGLLYSNWRMQRGGLQVVCWFKAVQDPPAGTQLQEKKQSWWRGAVRGSSSAAGRLCSREALQSGDSAGGSAEQPGSCAGSAGSRTRPPPRPSHQQTNHY